jgi:phosphoglycerate dehydrogenase-like enzyme
MTEAALPRIWFERPVLPGFVRTVEAACAVWGRRGRRSLRRHETAVAAVVGATPYDEAVMERAPGLWVIARPDRLRRHRRRRATRWGSVCNAPTADHPTAEHAVTLMLAVCKDRFRGRHRPDRHVHRSRRARGHRS